MAIASQRAYTSCKSIRKPDPNSRAKAKKGYLSRLGVEFIQTMDVQLLDERLVLGRVRFTGVAKSV